MPRKPLSPCRCVSCPGLTAPGQCYCERHAAKAARAERDRRGNSSQRGYDARWRRLRALVLARDPVCRYQACGRLSTDVDHIIPRSKGGTDSLDNLQGLCHKHHSMKTAQEDGGFGHYRP